MTLSGTGLVSGENRIRIVGDLAQFSTSTWPGTASALTAVEDWGGVQWTSMEKMFYGAANLVTLPTEAPELGSVISMRYMFNLAYKFNQDISNWNVSKVTDMSWMFANGTFNHPIGNWNVSNVTNMEGMFHYNIHFNQPIGQWDVSRVKNMKNMFVSAHVFNQPIGNWNVSNVTDMSQMFSDAISFNQPLNEWDVSRVTSMSYMFPSARTFNQPLDNWNVSNVTDMDRMFDRATSFNQNIHSWCAEKIPSKPTGFDNGGHPQFTGHTNKQPQW